MQNNVYTPYDLEAAKILDDFLPEKLFDAHSHISHFPHGAIGQETIDGFRKDFAPLVGNRLLRANAISVPDKFIFGEGERDRADAFVKAELDAHPDCVGEILVMPTDTPEEIEKRLVHKNVVGLKCYHIFAAGENTMQAGIDEYLPESAWEVASKHKLAITLHMVRDRALADPGNRTYIKEMAKKYPDATLILAHAARAFAAWTAIETVGEIAHLENVWYDFAAICESPAIMQIIKKVGISRCMWGTDYNICRLAGKAISLADTFYWINDKDLASFAGSSPTTFHSWLIATETLMAHRQACQLLDLSRTDVEDLFYNNAARLFQR